MRKLLIILTFSIFTICLVFCDQGVQTSSVNEKANDVEQSADSIKTKRGIHGFAGLRYLPPAVPHYHGINYIRHTPYSSFPGRIYTGPGSPPYALTPGNAVVHSYNANYPRIIFPRPVLRPAFPAPLPPPPPVFIQPKPIIPSVPVYTHRYPVFVQKPIVVSKPIVPLSPPVTQFAVPHFASTPHIHTTHSVPIPVPLPLHGGSTILPSSTLIPQNGWKPLYSSIPSISSPSPASTVPFYPSHNHINLAPSSHPHRPSNYYLPADPLPVHDGNAHSSNDGLSHEIEHYQQNDDDLQSHLQHLRQIQEFQHHQNFNHQQHDSVILPLSEQGYEPASNDGRYSGPSSYEVGLNSRGLL